MYSKESFAAGRFRHREFPPQRSLTHCTTVSPRASFLLLIYATLYPTLLRFYYITIMPTIGLWKILKKTPLGVEFMAEFHTMPSQEANNSPLRITAAAKLTPKLEMSIIGKTELSAKVRQPNFGGWKLPWPRRRSPAAALTARKLRWIAPGKEAQANPAPNQSQFPAFLGRLGQLAANCAKTRLHALNCANHPHFQR